jgi:hypothetical protein
MEQGIRAKVVAIELSLHCLIAQLVHRDSLHWFSQRFSSQHSVALDVLSF